MPRIKDMISWNKLTRSGLNIPAEFRVIRRPIETLGRRFEVGEILPPDAFSPPILKLRLRQFYESRLIEPAVAPAGTRQSVRANHPMTPATPTAKVMPGYKPARRRE
jgi:hypothetical protein